MKCNGLYADYQTARIKRLRIIFSIVTIHKSLGIEQDDVLKPVVSCFRGLLALCCPIPGLLGSTMSDVSFVFPDISREHVPRIIQDIPKLGKMIVTKLQRHDVWPQRHSLYLEYRGPECLHGPELLKVRRRAISLAAEVVKAGKQDAACGDMESVDPMQLSSLCNTLTEKVELWKRSLRPGATGDTETNSLCAFAQWFKHLREQGGSSESMMSMRCLRDCLQLMGGEAREVYQEVMESMSQWESKDAQAALCLACEHFCAHPCLENVQTLNRHLQAKHVLGESAPAAINQACLALRAWLGGDATMGFEQDVASVMALTKRSDDDNDVQWSNLLTALATVCQSFQKIELPAEDKVEEKYWSLCRSSIDEASRALRRADDLSKSTQLNTTEAEEHFLLQRFVEAAQVTLNTYRDTLEDSVCKSISAAMQQLDNDNDMLGQVARGGTQGRNWYAKLKAGEDIVQHYLDSFAQVDKKQIETYVVRVRKTKQQLQEQAIAHIHVIKTDFIKKMNIQPLLDACDKNLGFQVVTRCESLLCQTFHRNIKVAERVRKFTAELADELVAVGWKEQWQVCLQPGLLTKCGEVLGEKFVQTS